MSSAYPSIHFILGAHTLAQAPPDAGIEVAFAGRSNAGKSSALNAITGSKALARVSKTPGRTQQINFFGLDEERRLVDLPGYGYAKVPERLKLHWQRTLAAYLQDRNALRGLVLVMDIRHPLTPGDLLMLDWGYAAGMPIHILLTKADKLSRGAACASREHVAAALAQRYADDAEGPRPTVQLFSALKRTGIDEARACIERWLGLDMAKAALRAAKG